MCSRIGTITGENKHCLANTTQVSTKEAMRRERNERKRGKKQCVCAVEKDLETVGTR